MPREIGEIDGRFQNGGGWGVLFPDTLDAKRKGGKRELFVFEFEGRADGLPGENVVRKLQPHFDARKGDGRENAGHQDAGDQAGEDQEEEVVAGVEGGQRDENDADDIDPAFEGDPVFHTIANPAQRSPFCQNRNKGNGDPGGYQERDESGGAGEGDVAELRGGSGIKGEDKRDAECGHREEESADGGVVGFGEEGLESAGC